MTCVLRSSREVEARGASLYQRARPTARPSLGVFRWARDIRSFMLRGRIESPRRVANRERLKLSGMVDLLGMFRRRPAKRGAPGFARTRVDITALGDAIGEMLTSPVRDAPPIVRDAPVPKPHAPRTERPRPRAKTNGGGVQQVAPRTGYLAVHSVEKSFGTRQVVRGVSIYVRRGEAVGLLGPNGAGKTTVFYMITGLIKADRGAIELDGHDVTKLPMYQRARLGIGYLPQEASIFRGLTVEQNIRAVLEVVEPSRKKREAEL